MIEGLIFKDLLELGAVGVLALVIVVLLWFGYKTIERQSASQEKLADAINNLSGSQKLQADKLDNIQADLRRIDDNILRLRDDVFKRGVNS